MGTGLTIGLALAAASPAAAQRLPKLATPLHYRIALDPDLGSGSLEGDETIAVRIPQPTKTLVLNSVGFAFTSTLVRQGGATRPAAVRFDPASETATLELEPPALAEGDAEIEIRFTGRLRTDLRGLYVSKTTRRAYAVTQFEGTYARMAFPCFDEPEYKATFDLTVAVDRGDTAISNGRIASDTPGPGEGRHMIRFGTSPRMSTYLVALAIGDFQCLEGASDNTPIRVCAVPEKRDLGRFALQAAERFLHWYNRWYGIPYPFGKLDMLAMPDYEWGGMENTASIFYRDSALLLDEGNASVEARRGVASVVAHEMAHQWFGDLVTMRWWDDVWLNEGFATWMARKPLQAWDPVWDQDLDAAQSASSVLEFDSVKSTRAIRATAETPAEIKEMFDGISYEKGGAVLRMLEGYLGAEPFRAGVNAYLLKHRDGSATAEDFWQELERTSGKPSRGMAASFIDQAGAPLVSADLRCEGGKGTLVLRQRRLFNSAKAMAEARAELWEIPVCSRVPGRTEATCVVLKEREQASPLDKCHSALVLNADGRGYYRTEYPRGVLKAVSSGMTTALRPSERIGLIADQWSLVRAGKTPLADFLGLAEAFRGERERAVLESLLEKLGYVRGRLLDESGGRRFDKWLIDLLNPAAQRLGWQRRSGDSDDTQDLRALLLQVMGTAGDAEAARQASDLLAQYAKAPTSADATLLGAAFRVAAAHGGMSLYDDWLERLQKASTPEEHDRYLYSLAAFDDPVASKRSLELWSSPQMRDQDLPGFVAALLANPATRDQAWAALKANWPTLHDKVVSFGGGGAVPALVRYCDATARADIADFFSKHEAPGAERAVRRALEGIDNCLELKELQGASLSAWLAAH